MGRQSEALRALLNIATEQMQMVGTNSIRYTGTLNAEQDYEVVVMLKPRSISEEPTRRLGLSGGSCTDPREFKQAFKPCHKCKRLYPVLTSDEPDAIFVCPACKDFALSR